MGWEAWYTLAVIAMCFGAMATNRYAPDATLMGGLILLLLSGILTPQTAFAGLANEGVITVAALYVVVAGLRETGAIIWLGTSVLGRPKSLARAHLRLMAPVAVMSALLNNTPVVAMFIPAVNDWARKNKLSVSKLMIPLSYAAIVGGTCTLIGTSTNLVVNGLLIAQPGSVGLSMFELAWVGLPATVLTIVYIILFQKWLLPDRKPVIDRFADVRKYTVEMRVETDGPLQGKTVEEAGLRQLPGLYLIEIIRHGHVIPAVSPMEKLQGNDHLVFAGVVESVVDIQKIRGLQPATNQVFKLDSPREYRCLIEAVVSRRCPLVGKSIRHGKFRTIYNAAVIAVARDGEQIKKKIGDIVLHPGDTLLMEAHPNFMVQQGNSQDFYLVSQLEDSSLPRHNKAFVAITILIGMITCVTFTWLSILETALLAAGLMVLTRCTGTQAARRSINWQVLIVIASSFGIGNALASTGAAQTLANGLIAMSGGAPLVSLAATFLITALFTAIATNNTAAVLMFPIALATSQHLGASFLPFAVTIMVAASVSFATPIGYQTNLMVYGPGGYHFSDYIKIGTPLTILIGILTIVIVPKVWPF
jgi:di/tricarboxylate transporter